MSSRLIISALVAAGLSASLGTAQADEPLTAAALTSYAPYSDSDLPNNGFSNDLLVQAMKRTGHEVKVVMVPWARALAGTMDGTYDILPSTWYNEERAKALQYSEPYAVNRLVFVKQKGSPFEYAKLEDLKDKTVGIVNGYGYGDEFLNSTSFKREPAQEILINLRKVEAGRIDLTLDDELTLKYIIQTKAPELTDKLALTKGALSEQKLYMAFAKKRPDAAKLASDFNEGLAKMKADGSYEATLKAHKLE